MGLANHSRKLLVLDLVYVCRSGENEELRYSLRSIEENLPGHNVVVIGHKPAWYSGDFIPVKDIGNKFFNISNCLITACNTPSISSNFVFMNDDFFLLKPLKRIPRLHGGLLSDKIEAYRALTGNTNQYTGLLSKTSNKLLSMGITDAIDYDIHVPMQFNKKKLLSVISHGHLPRSIYGNIFNVGGKSMHDVKRYNPKSRLSKRSPSLEDESLVFISSDDQSFETIKNHILMDMFPKPSKYEYPQ